MAKCDVCGKNENMPYNCRHCGGTYCADHRLPENHDCSGLQNWNDPKGVFDSGFDDSVDGGSTSRVSSLASKIPINTGTGGPLAYFRGNMTYTFLALMWLTFAAEFVTLLVAPSLFRTLFVLTPQHPEYVWTWITSIFAHSPGGFFHIVGNSIVLFFFGPLVERYVGSRNFAILFIVSGVLAGLSQVFIQIFQGPYPPGVGGVLGASGAVLAIMGVLTILNPGLKVYLYFLFPVPIWLLTAGYAVMSITFLSGVIGGGGGIAHMAHLVGLVIGLAYGQYVKQNRNVGAPNRLEFGGGGPGGPGGPGGRRRF